jgi:tetratricopeptide (TPR) repeat protein
MYRRDMDAFAWEVIGSLAGVVAAGAGIVLGVIPLWQNRRKMRRRSLDEPVSPDMRHSWGSVQIGTVNRPVFQSIQTYIEHPPLPVRSEAPVIVGEVPQAPPALQPRDDLLAAVAASRPGPVLVRALIGMRGAGKTQAAAAYARSRIDVKWRLVLWIDASDQAGVLVGLADAASRLAIGGPGISPELAAKEVRHWLEADGERCLVVFDDVTDLDCLSRFLPAAGRSQVVVTSNQIEAGSLGLAVPVDVFSQQEGLAFLTQRTGLADQEGARQLGIELGWLPLALAQAGAVIATEHLSFPDYLSRLAANQAHRYLGRAYGEPYPRGSAEAIILALDAAMESDSAGLCRSLMDVVSLLRPAGTPRMLLHKAGQAGLLRTANSGTVPAEDIDAALGGLASASLLTFSFDNSAVIAHKLTMRVVLERHRADGDLPKIAIGVADLLLALANSLDEPWGKDRDAGRDTAQQILALHNRVNRHLGEQDAELATKLLRLRRWAIWCSNNLGENRSENVNLASLVVADHERLLGPDHPDTLLSRTDLAYAYLDRDERSKAIRLFEGTLADSERVLGAEHPHTLALRHGLAQGYEKADRLDEAIRLYERTLADRERVLGEDHTDTLITQNNLGCTYWKADRTAEAIPHLERAVAIQERALGPSHLETIFSRRVLEAAYRAAGRIEDATALVEENLFESARWMARERPGRLRELLALAKDRSRPDARSPQARK